MFCQSPMPYPSGSTPCAAVRASTHGWGKLIFTIGLRPNWIYLYVGRREAQGLITQRTMDKTMGERGAPPPNNAPTQPTPAWAVYL